MREPISKSLSRVAGLLLFGIGIGMTGFVVGSQRIWPYDHIVEGTRIFTSLILRGEVVGEGRQNPAPPGASRDFMTVHDPDAAIGTGYYAVLAWDSDRSAYSVFLYNTAGERIHTWPIDETAMSADITSHQNAPHAMRVLHDGSIVVSFDYVGMMARIGACGDIIWSRKGFFHHAFGAAHDGGLWTWYSGLQSAYGQYQTILKFDPMTGRDLARIELEDIIRRSPETARQFSMNIDTPLTPDDQNPADIFHPNDVEELLPNLAPAFPEFNAGDLLISIRELDMVAVISPSGDLKWSQRGPWLRQHDPDFEPDGWISVYDNSVFRPNSGIISINPQTRETRNALPNFTGMFKSVFRGKHQLLPNGNRLVVIPEQGQVLEITPAGAIAVEFNNPVPSNLTLNDDVANAVWLPTDYFETLPSCAK